MVTPQIVITRDILIKAFNHILKAKTMTEVYEENFKIVSKYVHATSRGHEAIQVATGMQLKPQDYLSPYYRDDAMLLSIGMTPFELMLQVLAKKEDPFSGGRTYYSHPSLNEPDKPKIPHQSSATGMQAIPATGAALGIAYKEKLNLQDQIDDLPIVVCSLGDASITEGEVSEAFQMAALHQLPILFLIQDNEWDISASADEVRAQNAYEFIQGFKGIRAETIDGSDFVESYQTVEGLIKYIRTERRPCLLHARVPLLNHHTSGVRMEWYRDDLEEDRLEDPYPKIKSALIESGFPESEINKLELSIKDQIIKDLNRAVASPSPEPSDLFTHDLAPTTITVESGQRSPAGGEEKVMVDCAVLGIEELMRQHHECLLYGQDVGGRLGGVFREAATLAAKFGDERVFNTPIQEAFIVGSTVGMSCVGLKPIVEVQFADYIWPGLNQLFSEVSRSYYLSNGKWPVSMILRVPIGAYGSGGPYHSSSIESVVSNIRGIKIVYPSNGADLKGLLKAAYYDPNPVIFFEHKGLYWSKVPGTDYAKTIEPSEDYVIPIGQGRRIQEATSENVQCTIVAYGMGVHWALNASIPFADQVEIIDLRSLYPLDTELIYRSVRKTGRCLVITEEPVHNSFAQSVSARIQENCFESLDAPVRTIGSENMPAIPLNEILEKTMLLNADKVQVHIRALLDY